MGSEAGYLLVVVGEGVPTVPLFGSRFWCENSKMAAKFKNELRNQKKNGREHSKKSKKDVRHYVAKTFFSAKASFIQCLSGPTARGGGSWIPSGSRPEGRVKVAGYTYVALQ